jgi:hypothetical protein
MQTDGGRFELVPASLIRIRRFMCSTGRIKVRPWTTAEETLDAFHDVLARSCDDDAFWGELRALLEKMTGDMRKRLERRGSALDNELIDPDRHEALLGEIRAAARSSGRGGRAFRRLASMLSPPAVGLLLLLGSAATIGCESSTRIEGVADASHDSADVDVVDVPPDTRPDTSADVPCEPDVPPDASCPHACMSFEEIVEECVDSEEDRATYLECIDELHGSWRTGLTELFACWDCTNIEDKLWCDFLNTCRYPDPDREFDLEEFLAACGCCIYLGVRHD